MKNKSTEEIIEYISEKLCKTMENNIIYPQVKVKQNKDNPDIMDVFIPMSVEYITCTFVIDNHQPGEQLEFSFVEDERPWNKST